MAELYGQTEELLPALFLSGGPDQSFREVAGTRPPPAERITEQAVGKRVQVMLNGPWA
jgi:hypothetical protein